LACWAKVPLIPTPGIGAGVAGRGREAN